MKLKAANKMYFSCLLMIVLWIFFLLDFNLNNIPLLINPKLITPVSPLYYLKTTREIFQSKFVFGDQDLSYWYFTLANKRLDEADILKQFNLKSLAEKQIKLADEYNNQGLTHLKPLIDVIDTNYLKSLYEKNQERISASTKNMPKSSSINN